MKVLILLFILCTTLFAADSTKTLRISTWPAGAEVYLGERPKNFIQPSAVFTPDSISLFAEEASVRVTLFKPGYRDTTIDIHMKSPTQNFVWIELQEESDLDRLEWQENTLGKRENKRLGKILFGVGSIPLLLSGVFVGIAEMKFNDAENARDKIEASIIQDNENLNSLERKFNDSKRSGKHYRTAALVSLGIGAVLLTTAVVFYF